MVLSSIEEAVSETMDGVQKHDNIGKVHTVLL
jgi:hypothetical protein